ncbi:MAG: glycosyltransferase family 39 protein [Cyanobacteria bacterium SZAS-4]|nr:glycosyltransferase family 39 protein [Cyanobacteria bacterium SZAS-4]
MRITKESIAVSLVGTILVIAAFVLPNTVHIEAVVPPGSVSSPDKSLIIVRWCCFLDGLWCLFMGLTGWRWQRLAADSLIVPRQLDEVELLTKKQAALALSVVVVAGLLLRCLFLDSSFWLDEITPLTFYRDSSVFGLLTTYYSTNNHLFYTLLEKMAVSAFGEHEWAVRLPSVLIGVATIPVFYLLTRVIANRWVSVATAFLLAVSYQHIFFSQNARGYTAHLLFTLAATLFLIRGIKKDKVSHWAGYCLCIFLNMASIIASLSVLIAHFLIAIAASIVVQRRSKGGWALFRRLSAVMFLALLLVLHLYSIIFPQANAVVQETYKVQSTGFTLFSAEFLNEVVRGLKIASGPKILLAAIPGLFISIAGLRAIFRCSWICLAALVLPEILLASYLLKQGLAVSPRFFLLALPFALLVFAVGFYVAVKVCLAKVSLAKASPQKKLPPALLPIVFLFGILCVAAVNLPSLIQYYKIPKQDFRSALLYVQSKPGKAYPFSIYTAREGVAYYANRSGLRLNQDFFDARTIPEFTEILQKQNPANLYLITTFPRALHLDHPELEPLMDKYWVVDKVFPGSIGDGDLTVWKPR